MYVNECLTKESIRRTLDCFCKGLHLNIAVTQSHRPEEATSISYKKTRNMSTNKHRILLRILEMLTALHEMQSLYDGIF